MQMPRCHQTNTLTQGVPPMLQAYRQSSRFIILLHSNIVLYKGNVLLGATANGLPIEAIGLKSVLVKRVLGHCAGRCTPKPLLFRNSHFLMPISKTRTTDRGQGSAPLSPAFPSERWELRVSCQGFVFEFAVMQPHSLRPPACAVA